MLHGLLYHSAVFICSACHLFTSAWSFYVRNPKDSLLTDEGSTGLRSHGTHGRLSDRETVNVSQKSGDKYVMVIVMFLVKILIMAMIIFIFMFMDLITVLVMITVLQMSCCLRNTYFMLLFMFKRKLVL